MSTNRQWMYNQFTRGILNQEFLDGLETFIAFASIQREWMDGVNVSSLEEFAAGKTDGLKRSNHVILVKNLPYGSTESELSDMFGKFGSLDKIILPPTKTLALIIFLEPAEARAAFRGLSYKRYKDGPLYLEWAPGNILSQTSTVGDDKVVGEFDVNRALLKQQLEEPTEADVEPDRIESRSVYVKNLNFRTSDASLKEHFAGHMKGGIVYFKLC